MDNNPILINTSINSQITESMRPLKIIALPLILLTSFISITAFAQPEKKLRVLVLTDIEADPDDTQSLIRFLTYSNQWDVEGLIAVSYTHLTLPTSDLV